jgi:hypothetical protein
MKRYLQTKTTENGDRGNCLATSLGCLLEIPVSRIPAFEEMDRSAWRPALTAWLREQGYTLTTLNEAPQGFAIGVGWRADGVLHAFIVNDGEFYHDPNPASNFVESVRNYWQLIPLNE